LLRSDIRFEWAKRRCCALLMPYMVELACDRIGGFVVEACFTALKECLAFPMETFPAGYHGKEVQRRDDCGRDEDALHLVQQLAHALSSARERLAGCRSGQALLHKLKLDHFRDDPASWERGIQKAHQKKAALHRMFEEIITQENDEGKASSTTQPEVKVDAPAKKRKRPLPVEEAPHEGERSSAPTAVTKAEEGAKKLKKKKKKTAVGSDVDMAEPTLKKKKKKKVVATANSPAEIVAATTEPLKKKKKKKKKVVE